MIKRNPWLAAVLNFIVPGIGYIYTGKRIVFAIGILVSMVLLGIYAFDKPYLLKDWLFNLTTITLSLAFAYDAYKEVKPGK